MSIHVAVIGSGMAGLAAARLCRDAGCRVTVFEAQARRGMDAHSISLQGGLVDVPLRVMSPLAWRHVIALAERVGVQTYPVNTYTTCSWLPGDTWFRSSRVPLLNWPVVGSWRYLNRSSWRLLTGFRTLGKAREAMRRDGLGHITLAEFQQRYPQDALFWRGLVLPILTTICTCSEEHLMAWPAGDLLDLLATIVQGDTLRRLKGGTPALVDGLARDLEFVSGSPVTEVKAVAGGMQVRNARGDVARVDTVIVATQANQIGFLDAADWPREHQCLSAIRFDHGELVVHRDTRFMPADRRDWSALHYQMRPDLSEAMFTVWVNPVENSLGNDDPPVFQTWNPLFAPDPQKVIVRVPLARAVVHGGTASALQGLSDLHGEPGRQLFFCGSWAYPGVPLLESAVRSAIAVVQRLGLQPEPPLSLSA